MNAGTLFLDKSAFQALSREHAAFLQFRFVHGLTPTLVYEILADLTKASVRTSPSDTVRLLATKFGGGGGVVNMPYQKLLLGELLGRGTIPMTGQIVALDASLHDVDGESSMFIGMTAFNDAILRWSAGEFHPTDLELAMTWRSATRNLSLVEFHAHVGRNQIFLPRPRGDLSDLISIVDAVIGDPVRHKSWMVFLLGQLRVPRGVEAAVGRRMSIVAPDALLDGAPYARFCLRALIAVSILWAHKMTKLEPNNYVDVQYLYYLPFCNYFASQDRLHLKLAPLLMRADQQFLSVDNLRQAVARPRAGNVPDESLP